MARAPFPIVSAPLTAVALNYAGINRSARGYIADMVAPRVRVPSSIFRWKKGRIEEAFTVPDTTIGRLGKANQITQSWTDETGQTINHGLEEPVPYEDLLQSQAEALPFADKAQAVRNVIDKVQLRREIRVAALATSASSYSAGYIDDRTAGTKWSDFANSDPARDIMDAQAGMLFPGSVGVTSLRVANILRRHPKVSVALGGSQDSGRYIPLDEIAALFGLSKIIVGNTIKQTSKPGQSLTTASIWPDSFAIHYQGPTGPDGFGLDVQSPNFLTTFQWNDVVSSERVLPPGQLGLMGGVFVFTGESIVEKQVSPLGGYLFQNVLGSEP